MPQGKRKKLWVDAHIQGAIMLRCVYYWAGCIVFLTIPLLLSYTFAEPSKLFYEHFGTLIRRHWPIYGALCCLLPFLLFDALRFTNRIAGPIYRMQTQMNKLIAGNDADSVQFRQGDFWQDLAGQFNHIAGLLKGRHSPPAS